MKLTIMKKNNGVTTMVAVDEADNRQLQKCKRQKDLSSQQRD